MDYVKLLSEAFVTPVAPERPSGCGRVYVVIGAANPEHVKGVRTAAKKLGKIFQARSHYGDKFALYVGYDNCSGHELARGTKVVEVLKAAGVSCWRTEYGD